MYLCIIPVFYVRQNISPCLTHWDVCPFYKHDLTLIPARISNYNNGMLYESINPFPIFNGAAVAVWDCKRNFIHIVLGFKISVSKRAPEQNDQKRHQAICNDHDHWAGSQLLRELRYTTYITLWSSNNSREIWMLLALYFSDFIGATWCLKSPTTRLIA